MLITKLIWPWFLWALLATVHCCVVFEPGVREPMFLETLEAGDKGIKRSGAAFLRIVPINFHRDRPSKRNYRWRIIVSGRNPEGSVWFQQEWRNIRGNLAQGRMWQGHDSLLFFVFGFKIPRGKTCINLVSFLFLYRYCLVRPHFKVKQTPQTYIQIVALDYHKQPWPCMPKTSAQQERVQNMAWTARILKHWTLFLFFCFVLCLVFRSRIGYDPLN